MRTQILSFTEHYLFEQHLKRLSSQDRLNRFDYPIADEQIEYYVRNIRVEDLIIALFTSSKVIGAAHLSIPDHEAYLAKRIELGLSIESEYQDLGLGTDLMHASIATAQNAGFQELMVRCQSHNTPMLKVLEKFHGAIESSKGACYGSINLIEQQPFVRKDKAFGLDYLRSNIVFAS